MSDFRQDYNPPSRLPGADAHELNQELSTVGAPADSQWHNSEGLVRSESC